MPPLEPAASPAPSASEVPSVEATFQPYILRPTIGPSFPKAGSIGVLVIALAYFSLGVAVGALLKQSPGGRRWLPFLVIPGVLAAIAFVAWVIRTLV
jgi:hypothetical protein